MAAIDFPAGATAGQLFQAPNGSTYKYLTPPARWAAADARAGSSPVSIGPVAPVSPVPGTLWWNSEDGDLYVWYDDGNSQAWVPANATGTGVQAAMSAADNLLINGGFDIWQRGTTFSPTGG